MTLILVDRHFQLSSINFNLSFIALNGLEMVLVVLKEAWSDDGEDSGGVGTVSVLNHTKKG